MVLSRAGFEAVTAATSPDALRQLHKAQPDLAILDVNLGVWDGFELLKEIRRASQMPIIMLSGRDGEDDKVRGLELGADDYQTKPVSPRELLARVRAHLRKHGYAGDESPQIKTLFEVGPLTLNLDQYSATKDGRELKLTPTEFKLLHCLMAQPAVVVRNRDLLREVWGYDDLSDLNLVRTTVHRLRRKLDDDPNNPTLLHTIPGVGIMLKVA